MRRRPRTTASPTLPDGDAAAAAAPGAAPAAPPPPGPRGWIDAGTDIVNVILVVCATLCLYNFIRVGWMIASEPHILNYTEGISLLCAQRVRDGLSLYPDIQQPPFVYLAYPPVYPIVSAILVKAMGLHLLPLRLLSLVCELGIGVLAYRILTFYGVTRLRAICCAAFLLGVFSTHKFHGLARLDWLLVVMEVAIVDLVLRTEKQPTRWRLVALGALAVIAMLTKPTAAVTLAVMGTHALIRAFRGDRPVRRVAAALLIAGVVYFGCVIILQVSTDGRFFRNTVEYQAMSGVFSQWRAYGPLAMMWNIYGPLIIVLGALALCSGAPTLLILTVLQFVWLMGATRKMGADANYQLVPYTFLAITAGLSLSPTMKPWSAKLAAATRMVPWRGVVAPLAIVMALVLTQRHLARGYSGPGHTMVFFKLSLEAGPRAMRQRVVDGVRNAPPGPVLVEEPYFAVVNEREYIMSDPFQLIILAKQGRFDMAPVVAEIAEKVHVAVIGLRLHGVPEIMKALRKCHSLGSAPAMDYQDLLELRECP